MTVCDLDGCDNKVTRSNARFCSRTCGHKGQARPGKANLPKRERCTRDLHPLSGTNLRIDNLGRRSCKACAATARKREDAPARTRSKPKPRPTPVPVAAPEPAVWRPAGFTPAPAVRKEAS